MTTKGIGAQLAVVVRDALGASVRCSTGLEPGVLVQVVSSPAVVGDPVTYAGSLVDTLLYNNLNESKAGVVLANLGLLSQFLLTSTDPCSAVACGSFGVCFLGVCTCNSGSGYTGPVCSIAPVPVHGLLGPWVAVGSCSVSCGGGWQQYTRACTPPLFGGEPSLCWELVEERAVWH